MKNLSKKLIAIAILASLTAFMLVGCSTSDDESSSSSVVPPTTSSTVEPPQTSSETPPSSEVAPSTEPEVDETPSSVSPTGVTKQLHYNNSRYSFLQDGAEMEIAPESLGAQLGVLSLMDGLTINEETGMAEVGENGYGNTYADFASTYMDGGTVYELADHSSDYRVAVEKDGKYYVAEKSGNYDNSPLAVDEYFTNSGLMDKVVGVDIYNHMGDTLHKSLTEEETKELLNSISVGTGTDSSELNYDEIVGAQSSGQSYKMHLMLEDGTYTTSYIMPSLNMFSLGDGYAMVESFGDSIMNLFDGLGEDNAQSTPSTQPQGAPATSTQ